MKAAELRKWLAAGTGVGIEIGPPDLDGENPGAQDLNIAVARARPSGTRILGSLTIAGFRSRPAAEWGAVYAGFLKKRRARHLTATVMLPREDVVVRQVSLPGVNARDIPAALNFQIESLHPYSDEEIVYDWARIGRTPLILVGITRRAVLDHYVALFNEAGVKVSAFTFSAAVMYSAVRLYAPPPAAGFVALASDGPAYEAYGESPSHPLFSAHLDMPEQRARTLAISELRLPPEAEPLSFEAVLPKPVALPAGEDPARIALPYATALNGACPRLSLRLNLLPDKERAVRSRWAYAPTIALACILLLLAAAAGMSGNYENRRYLATLDGEMRHVAPLAKKSAALDREVALLRNRAQTLDNFRLRSKEDMDALNELTRVLAPPTWLNGLQLTRTQLTISGETDQATPLLKALDGAKQFKRSEFTLPMARMQNGESFSIRSAREGIAP